MSDKKEEVPYLTASELENEFQTWSSFQGDYEEMQNGMPFYRIRHYPTAMNALVLRFIEIGYSEKQIRSDYLVMQLQRFCTPHKHPNKAPWQTQIKKHWDFAVNARFPATTKLIEAEPIGNQKATVQLESPKATLPDGLKRAKTGELIKDYEVVDLSKIKGMIESKQIVVETDPLAFLKEDKNE